MAKAEAKPNGSATSLDTAGSFAGDEAMANIRDAIQGYLQSLKKHGEPIPAPITEAIVEVPV
jgi:hypothetical protein